MRYALDLERDQALALLNARVLPTDVAEGLLADLAIYTPGDEVRWFESPKHPFNRGEVVEGPVLAGGTVCYWVSFPGPEGVGHEENLVAEHNLRFYDTEEGDG